MLLLPAQGRADLERWVRDGYPHETCGVLVGRSEGAWKHVERCVQARNLAIERAHDRFELDPQDFMAADVAARAEGLSILGLWHSHPDLPAVPSATDRAAVWKDWSYLILSVGPNRIEAVRCWRHVDGRLREDEIRATVEACSRSTSVRGVSAACPSGNESNRARAERAPTTPRP